MTSILIHVAMEFFLSFENEKNKQNQFKQRIRNRMTHN